ncbi:UDP-sulfoquinovose synthase (EC [Olavius algarvensis associated proteobacterium Delta 3]|nr:UDP-sulfoquinovose synthase (EC [Olavius algarvensis associated proteobacterium Delta 3]
MKILILGGDGYFGWPTAMHLSAQGHQVAVVDNYLRRSLCREENVEPLVEVPNLHQRAALWESVAGYPIPVFIGDLRQWETIEAVFRQFEPESIVHFAEQPAAPYSMLNRRSATLTLRNNLDVTANVIFAVKQFNPAIHIVKLGTMGEYGTPAIDIEEGWLEVEHKGRRQKFLYPRQAGSLYHTTKIMDTDLLWFYVRVWELRVTDLMQGPVYGIFTQENRIDEALCPFLNYDELFGTVLNRFVIQAVADYPMTVYGKGGQTRGYLNIIDTLNCVRLALVNSPANGELRILNQFTETFSVNQLAQKVQSVARAMGYKAKISSVENPRKEAEDHYYNPAHTGLLDLGLKPQFLTGEVLSEMIEFAARHKTAIRPEQIFRKVRWD